MASWQREQCMQRPGDLKEKYSVKGEARRARSWPRKGIRSRSSKSREGHTQMLNLTHKVVEEFEVRGGWG